MNTTDIADNIRFVLACLFRNLYGFLIDFFHLFSKSITCELDIICAVCICLHDFSSSMNVSLMYITNLIWMSEIERLKTTIYTVCIKDCSHCSVPYHNAVMKFI